MFHFYCDDRKVTEIAKNSKEERMLNTETDAKSKKENLIERRKQKIENLRRIFKALKKRILERRKERSTIKE